MLDLSNKKSLYSIYKRKKSNGKVRIIHAPKPELKCLQNNIGVLLQGRYDAPDSVHGFVKGRNASTLAANHTNKDWVITVDIKDFFPSVTRDMVLSVGLSMYWADAATYDDKLVQGSPCSPIISNMVFEPLDKAFSTVFKRRKIRYDRYADDIVISGYGNPSWGHINYIKAQCEKYGFIINTKKTKFMFKNHEQRILGITVNTGVSVNSKIRKALKNKIKYEGKDESSTGYISYINSVNKEQYDRLKVLN